MKQGRFNKEQVTLILKEAAGLVTELYRRHRVSDVTFYTWRSKYGGIGVFKKRRLSELEKENQRFK